MIGKYRSNGPFGTTTLRTNNPSDPHGRLLPKNLFAYGRLYPKYFLRNILGMGSDFRPYPYGRVCTRMDGIRVWAVSYTLFP